ncbi:MAG: ArsR/SmtB family transcription factor [Desulfobacterales bacterium]
MSRLVQPPILPGAVLDRETLARICKALGHPVRIQILQHLQASGKSNCSDIVSRFPLAQSTVSQHLKFLREAGVIHCEAAGPARCYDLNKDLLARFGRSLGRMWCGDE